MKFARALREADLPYMVVGAHAVMAHGYARLSSDIDFVVHVAYAEEQRVIDVVKRLGHETIERRKDEWGRRVVVDEGGLEVEFYRVGPTLDRALKEAEATEGP